MPDFLLPFGPFHIVILHLPIGVLAALYCVECLLREKGQKASVIGLLHLILIGSTALTIVLGLAYEDLGKYGEELEAHELWGFIFGGCVVLSYALHCIARFKTGPLFKRLYLASLLLSGISVTVAGHYGGELVHGKGFLTKSLKEDTRQKSPSSDSTQPESPESTPTEVEPTLEPAETVESTPDPNLALFLPAYAALNQYCYECHGADKVKGGYRVDSKAAIFTPGKSDLAPIVAGNPDDSELVYRLLLPADDDEIMPPENKGIMPANEIQAIVDWITAGAVWPDKVPTKGEAAESDEVGGNPATDALIEKINATGAKAEYNAWGDQTVRVDLGVVDINQFETAIIAVSDLAEQLSWLDCSDLELPDSFFQQLPRYQNLRRLHLDSSSVTDQNLESLPRLPQLSYLNLYNTQISDEAVQTLASCTNLEKIYLSRTQMTKRGIQELQAVIPDLEIIYK